MFRRKSLSISVEECTVPLGALYSGNCTVECTAEKSSVENLLVNVISCRILTIRRRGSVVVPA